MIRLSLADLGKILEEAASPDSQHREDRRETKAKEAAVRKGRAVIARPVDPKRRAWYERRLREQGDKSLATKATPMPTSPAPVPPPAKPVAARVDAVQLGGTLLQSLAAAKEANKTKNEGKSKVEAWRRKPGDPIF